MQPLSPSLPPLVALLLLAFLWFILLVLLLWFALSPRRSPDVPRRARRPADHRSRRDTVRDEAGAEEADRRAARTPRVVRDPAAQPATQPAAQPSTQEDAFDAYAKPAHRRDEFDF